MLRRVQLFVTPWTVACQVPLSMEFSRPEYWSGLPFASPVGLPNPGIKPMSPALQADSLPSEPPGKPYSIVVCMYQSQFPILYLLPFFPPWQPYICFPHLWLYFCFVNRFICTIFLDATYKQYHMNLSFSDLFSSVWLSLDPSKSLQMGLFHSFFNFRSKNVLKIRYRNDLESFVLP